MLKCNSCTCLNPEGQRFCGECGVRLTAKEEFFQRRSYTPAHLAEKILRTRGAIEGERKPVTVLFCDVVGSTGLAERLGAERMHSVLNAFFEAALAEVHQYEGTVNQFLGDGFMALFGAPVAHEDHARRAVLAALAIRQAVSTSIFSAPEPPLRLRMGLHTGAVVVGSIGDNLRMDYTAVGDVTNVAARIQSQAEPSEILMSAAVWQATQAFVQCRFLGERVLKGKSEPLALYELQQAHIARGGQQDPHPSSLLVGRQAESSEIKRAVIRLRHGQGGILGLFGEAGLGKSRLMNEARRLAAEQNLRWLQGDCLSFGKTLSYWPFREVIRRGFSIDESDSEIDGWRKVDAGMRALFEQDQADELLPFIGTLLAVPLPENMARRVDAMESMAVGHQIFRAALLLCERTAKRHPLVIALEDWHWADLSSATLLQHLLPLTERVPLLFVVACRPETQGPAESFRLALSEGADPPLPSARVVRLAPLTADDSVQLAEELLRGGTLAPEVSEVLLKRSEGNPFYLVELVRTLRDTRAIEPDLDSGEWRTTAVHTAAPLPSTIEGLILARVDRLEDEAKEVLKAAAVVGRTFFYRVLQAVTAKGASALDDELGKLGKADLIEEKQSAPEPEYIFRHPLIQQATYDSLLEERKREMHRQVGKCIESLFAGRLDSFYSMLAYHYSKGQEAEKAREYLLKAADHADRLAADEEALELYNAVLADAERSPLGGFSQLERAQLDMKIGDAHFRAGRLRQARVVLAEALERLEIVHFRARWRILLDVWLRLLMHGARGPKRLVDQSGPMTPRIEMACQIWERMAWIDFFIDPVRAAYDTLQMLRLASRWPRSPFHIVALSNLGNAFDAMSMYRPAERFHNAALELTALCVDDNAKAMAELSISLHSHATGQWASAMEHGKRAAMLAKQAGNPRLWAAAIVNNGFFGYSMGERDWMHQTDEFARIAEESNNRQAHAWGLQSVGSANYRQGKYQASIDALKRAEGYFRSIPDPRVLAINVALQSSCCLGLGRVDDAVRLSDEAMALIRRHRITGTNSTHAHLAAAEVALAMLERNEANDVAARRRKAEVAVKAMLRHAQSVRDDAPVDAKLVAGTFEWLSGRRDRALKHWEAGLIEAEVLGARYSKARILAERGVRLGNPGDVTTATALFEQCGATGDVYRLQALNRSCKGSISSGPRVTATTAVDAEQAGPFGRHDDR